METSNKDFGEILKKGEALYLGSLKKELETDNIGKYAAIDVDSEKYVIDVNKLEVIKKRSKNSATKNFTWCR